MNEEVAVLACALASQMPPGDLRELSSATADGRQGLLALRARSAAVVTRNACDRLLAVLSSCSPDYLAGALVGAARSASDQRRSGTVDVVWTGPQSGLRTNRLTSAVIVDLIAQASQEVILVSFAAQTEPLVAAALQTAVDRGVEVTLLLERQVDNPTYSGPAFPFPMLAARRLSWPSSARPQGAALHAKVMVIDGSLALVGSANLTGHALERNLECGVLLRGGAAPPAIRVHLLRLLDIGVLQPIVA